MAEAEAHQQPSPHPLDLCGPRYTQPQLPALIYRLLPLLELIGVKYDCNIPLDCLREHAAEADTSLLGKQQPG